MSRTLKYILIILGVLAVFIIGMITYVQVKGIPTYTYVEHPFTVRSDSAKVALGYKLSLANCSHCHSPLEGVQLTGRFLKDMGPDFGNVYSANITQHPTAGIGAWTDGQLATFIRTGVRKDGSFAPPYMPKFPLMADEDLEAIIAFLKSDHPSVQASDKVASKSEPSFLVKALCNFVIKPFPYPESSIPKPSPDDQINYGKYLATGQLGCFHCHSADFTKVDALVPEQSAGFFGGGNKIYDHNGDLHLSANITMDETGIADYTETDLIEVLHRGIKKDKTPVSVGMPRYPMLEPQEITAIYAYLQTVPHLNNVVPKPNE